MNLFDNFRGNYNMFLKWFLKHVINPSQLEKRGENE